jgi:hypothetical protein
MTNQTKNPIFWCTIAVVLGIIIGIIGWNRNEAIGNYKGAGFLIWTGCILIAGGIGGWFIFGSGNRK